MRAEEGAGENSLHVGWLVDTPINLHYWRRSSIDQEMQLGEYVQAALLESCVNACAYAPICTHADAA